MSRTWLICAPGVSILVTMMPSLDPADDLGRWSAAVIEAVLVALRDDPQRSPE